MTDNNEVDNKWGVWYPVNNEVSARYAIKMSGLPFFVIGLSIILFVFFRFDSELYPFFLFVGLIGIFLLWSGLQLRKGLAGTFILSLILWLINYVRIVTTAIFGDFSASLGTVLFIQTLFGILALSGIRGWWWLRKNQKN